MDNNPFLKWILSEAGAGWVFGIISLIALIASFISRKRTSKIVIKEIYKTTLVKVNQSIKDRISITFDGVQIREISQMDLEIYNDGSDVIKDAEIFVNLPKESNLLHSEFTLPVSSYDVKLQKEDSKISFKLPYINPFREHKQSIILSLTISGALNGIKIEGSGEGWTVSHIPTQSVDDIFRSFSTRLFLAIGLSGLAGMLSIGLKERYLGISFWDSSPQSLIATLPFTIVVVGLLYWAIKPMYKNRKGLLR